MDLPRQQRTDAHLQEDPSSPWVMRPGKTWLELKAADLFNRMRRSCRDFLAAYRRND